MSDMLRIWSFTAPLTAGYRSSLYAGYNQACTSRVVSGTEGTTASWGILGIACHDRRFCVPQ